jgi:hypothetical protein
LVIAPFERENLLRHQFSGYPAYSLVSSGAARVSKAAWVLEMLGRTGENRSR